MKSNASPSRKVALGTSKIQINVGADFAKEVKAEAEASPVQPVPDLENVPQEEVTAKDIKEEGGEPEETKKEAIVVGEAGDAPVTTVKEESNEATPMEDVKGETAKY